jgi:hypothetical protein
LPVAISKPSSQVEVVGKSASLATVHRHVKIIRRGRIGAGKRLTPRLFRRIGTSFCYPSQ